MDCETRDRPSNTAPAYQTNGNVSTIAYSKASDIVYIGGDFTSVRPPGAAPGHRPAP